MGIAVAIRRRLTGFISSGERRNAATSFVFVAVVVFLSRLPFIDTGYGRDPDAWRLFNAAHLIRTTGEYHASRMPGYPVPEFVHSLLLGVSSYWPGLVVALSAIGAATFS